MLVEREIDLISTFVVRQKRQRYLDLLGSKRGRRKLLADLHHFGYFEPECVVRLPSAINSVEQLVSELRRRGADAECYVMSAVNRLDGLTGVLEDVMADVYAQAEATLVSCAVGRLAYYEGEAPDNRFLLEKKDTRRR